MNDKQTVELPEPYAYETAEPIDENTAELVLWHWPMGCGKEFPPSAHPLFTEDQVKAHAEQYARAMVGELAEAAKNHVSALNYYHACLAGGAELSKVEFARERVHAARNVLDAVLAKLGDGK